MELWGKNPLFYSQVSQCAVVVESDVLIICSQLFITVCLIFKYLYCDMLNE